MFQIGLQMYFTKFLGSPFSSNYRWDVYKYWARRDKWTLLKESESLLKALWTKLINSTDPQQKKKVLAEQTVIYDSSLKNEKSRFSNLTEPSNYKTK